MMQDNGDVRISDPAFNISMRRLSYPTHEPVPATWPYKSGEELQDPTLTDSKADVYAWASVAYEVRTVYHDFDTIISTCIVKVLSGKQPYHGYHPCRGVVKIINEGHRALRRPREIPPQLWNIFQRCWMPNAVGRPSMDQVVSELRELDYHHSGS
jgi:Protein tyrosine and serine/threonine kinase